MSAEPLNALRVYRPSDHQLQPGLLGEMAVRRAALLLPFALIGISRPAKTTLAEESSHLSSVELGTADGPGVILQGHVLSGPTFRVAALISVSGSDTTWHKLL